MKLYLDCESVGLMGPTKLVQFAIDDGPVQFIQLPRGWEADSKTRCRLAALIGYLDEPTTCFVAFNAAFDLFHIYRLAHRLHGLEYDSPERPVMPFKCKVLDLQIPAMLKSPLAPFAFNRGSGKSVALLRRIPVEAQEYVSELVCQRLKPLLPSSFKLNVSAHKVPKQPKLVTLGFNVDGRLSLKGLMQEYGIPTIKLAEVWPLPEKGSEKPWLPYPDPAVHDPIEAQCDMILRGPRDSGFYRYSELDILYLKVLYEKLGRPEPDYNSDNVHNIAYLRYYGFDLDKKELESAAGYYRERVERIEAKISGVNLRSSTERLALLKPHFPIIASTSKKVLATLAGDDSEGARLCRDILDYGPSRQRLLQIEKVRECRTGKAHPTLRVMGTATNRMAGEAGLNWQGIGAVDEVFEDELPDYQNDEQLNEIDEEMEELATAAEERKVKVGLRNAILTPCVGDWSSFEVVIAATVYDDKQLQADLDAGVDLHSMASVASHPKVVAEGLTYDQFRAIYKDHSHPRHHEIDKIRKQMKAVVFGTFYFASAMKVAEVLGLADYEGQQVLDRFYNRYQGIGRYRKEIEARFITADTERWSKGCIEKMESHVTDLTGFERHWTFEKGVAEALWSLGNSKSIKTGLSGQVVRTQAKGPQSYDMAITSACLGSAIAIQAAVSRQAGNMKIQATGSSLTKKLASEIWNRLRVPTLSCHDELIVPHHPNYSWGSYSALVDRCVKEAHSIVPRVSFSYAPTTRWSDK